MERPTHTALQGAPPDPGTRPATDGSLSCCHTPGETHRHYLAANYRNHRPSGGSISS